MRHLGNTGMLRTLLLGATILAGSVGSAAADIDDGRMDNETQTKLPSGQYISPTAATGAVFTTLNPKLASYPAARVGGAIKTAVSPDGRTLLILASGYNNYYHTSGASKFQFDATASNEYVFVYDISGAHRNAPLQTQIIAVPNTYVGLAFAPDGRTFYASGGVDDQVYAYAGASGAQWSLSGTIKLGHHNIGIGAFQQPSVAGLATSVSGRILVAANIYNDSISIIDTAAGTVLAEYDLRPYNTTPATGMGVAGGETPFGVAIRGESTVYVSSIRDREVVVVDISKVLAGGAPALVTRIALPGNPNSMIFGSAAQTRLFVAQDNSDTVAEIDTTRNAVMEEIDAVAPEGLLANPERFAGAAPNALAISPDEQYLYVSNAGENAIAVIPMAGPKPHRVAGLIPTGWYPNSVSVSDDGRALYVVNGKSDPGPNKAACAGIDATAYNNNSANGCQANGNGYILQLEHAGFLTLPTPRLADLPNLSRIVAANNGYNVLPNRHDEVVMAGLRQHIRHVIYIVKENRTFDQVLGDLENGANADPSLTEFGRALTPNFHRVSEHFVTLDNFFCSGEVSGNGWPWSISARETDMTVKTIPLNYANSPLGGGRGAVYEGEGQNRDVSVGLTLAQRETAEPIFAPFTAALKGGTVNLLPGPNNDAAPDGPDGANRQTGYIWDSAVRAGLTVRNYGFLVDGGRYGVVPPAIPLDPTPFAHHLQVAYPLNPTLLDRTDIYFRGFDNAFPDLDREQEWEREFDLFSAGGNLPNLSLVRLMHDHFGSFSTAIGGINTPEIQAADNDYAVGRLIDKVAHSRFRDDTLIFVLEDDAQDAADHMDAHRSTAYVVGPYVRHHAVVSTRYSTVNMLRTIEDVLGIDHLNLNDAYQRPMTDLFDLEQRNWTYHAVASTALANTSDAMNGTTNGAVDWADATPMTLLHDAAYWAEQTEGFDWSGADRVPAELFNQILWDGLKPGAAYPAARSGADLSRKD